MFGGQELRNVVVHFVDSNDEAPRWASEMRNYYDSHAGFFRLDPVTPHIDIDLKEIFKYLLILKVWGLLDRLEEHIPKYSAYDVAHWILRHVFSGAKNPFRKKSLYRYQTARGELLEEVMQHVYGARDIPPYLSCEDISSSLGILYLVGYLHELPNYCDHFELGKAFGILQKENSIFRPTIDSHWPDRCPTATALNAIVAMNLLDIQFGMKSIESLRVEKLKSEFRATRDIANLVREFITAEDALNQYEEFWTVWQIFYPKIVELCRNEYQLRYSKSTVYNYLFALEWREGAKEWHSLKDREKTFFKKVAEDIGGNSAVLYSLAKLLNDIGSGFASDGISWISGILQKNPDLSRKELEVNTVYYLENLIRSYILKNRRRIRINLQLKTQVLVILDFLLEKASVTAYLLREDIL